MTESKGNTFGLMLRRLRLAAGLSQEELAERAGLTPAGVGALERGERKRPYPHTIQSLADALGLAGKERADLIASIPERRPMSPSDSAAASTMATGLPAPVTPIVGRESDVATVLAVLAQPGARLVTITGPGGVGKTRLALEVARRLAPAYDDCVAWVELSAIAASALVLPTIERSLGLPEGPGAPVERRLAGYLRRRRLLLILDNFEHVVEAAGAVAGLLHACPGLSILVTSREALRVRGEHEVSLAPLGLPDAAAAAPDDITTAGAVQLFLERARALLPNFELRDSNARTIAELCRRLDGLPLALELAAVQLRYMTPKDLLRLVERDTASLPATFRDVPERQRSLTETLRWSHRLLSTAEQALFRRLAVFPASFSAEAAVSVCAGGVLSPEGVVTALAALVDKSLVQAQPGEAARFSSLQTIRQFAGARLEEAGEVEWLRNAHAQFFAGAAELAEPHMHGTDAAEWIEVLEHDAADYSSALEWSTTGGDRCTGMRIAKALAWFWLARGRLEDADRWTGRLLTEPRPPCPSGDVAAVLYASAATSWKRGELEQARRHAHESIAVFRSLTEPRRLAMALAAGGLVAVSQHRFEDAVTLHEESLALFEAAGDRWGTGYARSNLGDTFDALGQPGLARSHYEAALGAFTLEDDAWGTAIVSHTLGNVALKAGEYETARGRYRSSAALCHLMGNRMEAARALVGHAAASLALGDASSAEQSLKESRILWDEFGNDDGVALCLAGLAAVAVTRGALDDAVRLLRLSRDRSVQPSLYVVAPDIFEPYLGPARQLLSGY